MILGRDFEFQRLYLQRNARRDAKRRGDLILHAGAVQFGPLGRRLAARAGRIRPIHLHELPCRWTPKTGHKLKSENRDTCGIRTAVVAYPSDIESTPVRSNVAEEQRS